jgi:histidyl-tRNA synthetase
MLKNLFKKKNKQNKNKAVSIKPLSGILELSPRDQIQFDKMKKTIANTYEKFGFIPLDVETISRTETLLAKAGGDTEKEIYRIKKGDKDLALRFDLTVPLARYVAANYNEIDFPFRRYQIGKVFRGERPQKGRFRELYQCDIDIIGDGDLNIKNDAEIPSIIYSIFQKLGIGPFVIKINNRRILAGLLKSLNLASQSTEIMRALDKFEKIGQEELSKLLEAQSLSSDQIKEIFKFVKFEGTNQQKIEFLKELEISNPSFIQGVEELGQVLNFAEQFGIPSDYLRVDFTITRGLDYYTGTVYETFLVDYPEFGSICSGGRYDNLTQFYSNRKMPGVGISIGLSRLFSQLMSRGFFDQMPKTTSEILIIPLTDQNSQSVSLASKLRKQDIKVEIYSEAAQMKKMLNYANKKGYPFVVIIGEDEIREQNFTLKNMRTGEQSQVSDQEIVETLLSSRVNKN